MTVKQYTELLEYINQNNGWGDNSLWKNGIERRRACFKYVDASFDTRFGDIWQVKLRDALGCPEKVFRVENEEQVKELYAFLDKQY